MTIKKIIFASAIILFGIQSVYAQMHISTFLRKDAVFNEKTMGYDIKNEDKEELTFFEFNKELTMFKHTTPTLTSAYTVKSSKVDKENELWELDIVSDIGNSYLMILDLKKNNIRFIYIKNGYPPHLIQYSIKKLWFDD